MSEEEGERREIGGDRGVSKEEGEEGVRRKGRGGK